MEYLKSKAVPQILRVLSLVSQYSDIRGSKMGEVTIKLITLFSVGSQAFHFNWRNVLSKCKPVKLTHSDTTCPINMHPIDTGVVCTWKKRKQP